MVTFNLRGFPAEALREAADMQHPPTDLPGLLTALQSYGVPNFAEAVRRMARDDR